MAAGVVLSLVTVFLLASWYPALRFTGTPPTAAPSRTAAPVAPVASFTPSPAAPASRVVRELLAATPAGLPGGMVDASAVPGTVSPAVRLSCDEPVGPVVSRQRGWASTTGPMGTGITVTASAYSAGAGAAALAAMRTARPECRAGVAVSAASGAGVEALSASTVAAGAPIRSVVLRRGDVLVSITGARADVPWAMVADLDARLDGLLSAPGVCLDQRADAAAFARSLVSGPKTYRGLTVATPVALPSAGELPPLATPSAPLSVPAPVTATTPAEPYWPREAPSPLASPAPPSLPAPYVTATSVPRPEEDPAGPGCGWAFTGMRPPQFDEAGAQRLAAERAAAAVEAMRAGIAAYPAKVERYRASWQDYVAAVGRYEQVNAQIAQVEQQWAVIRAQQEQYQADLARYQAELADWQSFGQRQQQAALDYQAALVACASAAVGAPVPPSAVPTDAGTPTSASPSPTDSPVPGPTTPTPATETSSAAAAPLPAAPLVCPPVPDPIIAEQPPVSPVSPLPPPDPRPTPTDGASS